MFYKLFALFALLAVAFAAPKPQVVAYSSDYVYPSVGVPSYVSAYNAFSPIAPVAYSAYPGYPYPANAVFVK